ncbi:ABC transporter permease [bacterium]|nr:ABC transporter permease [bacterium]RQV94746.1 MAG: ABC transporter permease [bacterium]
MFKIYFKIAIRSLLRFKKFSIINILGLAIGLSCFILIMLWVQDELSYDHFHKNADHIYLALRNDNGITSGITSKMLAPALKDELPEVVEATSFVQLPASIKLYLKYENKGFEENFNLVDPIFFNIFSFRFIDGNPQSAFLNPNSIVLTENIARKYFGDKNALGKSLHVTLLGQTRTLKVTGILENIPHNSHFQREVFIPISYVRNTYGIEEWDRWGNYQSQTYILTRSGIDISAMEHKIADLERKNLPDHNLENLSYSLLPLKKMHLHSNNIEFFSSTGDIKYIYIFTIIAGIILLIASMNYINLSNALSLKRTKEIGIQKVVGAHRSNLVRQYFGETLIITLIALGCALLFVKLLLPVLNRLADKSLSAEYSSPHFLIMIILIALITSVISGLYPAVFISGFQPVRILKGRFQAGKGGLNLRKGLILLQFSLSIIMIICMVIVLNQLDFIKNSNLGYDKENIVCFRIKGNIHGQYDAFKNEILENDNILSISRTEHMDISSLGSTGDIYWPGRNENQSFRIWLLHCDCDFASTYKIDMDEGRFYSDQFPTDKTNGFVLNKAAVEAMGLQLPIGQEITLLGRKGQIIGITHNFHFSSFHTAIEPLVFRTPDRDEQHLFYRELSIRLRPNSIQQSMSFLENKWESFFTDEPVDYYFFDESLDASYRAEQRMGELSKYFSFLAIFIACLGLHGLTAFTIEQKTKDIGIYKALGATVSNIVFLLSKNYLWLVILSNVIAWPTAYFMMNKWLQNFAYHINMSWWIFVIAGGIALFISLLTVSCQAIRAATANPVESLRYE